MVVILLIGSSSSVQPGVVLPWGEKGMFEEDPLQVDNNCKNELLNEKSLLSHLVRLDILFSKIVDYRIKELISLRNLL